MNKFSIFATLLVIAITGVFSYAAYNHQFYTAKAGDTVLFDYVTMEPEYDELGEVIEDSELTETPSQRPYSYVVGADDNYSAIDELVKDQLVGFEFSYEAEDEDTQFPVGKEAADLTIIKIKKCIATNVSACK